MAYSGLVEEYPKEWWDEIKTLYREHQERLSEYIDLLLWWNQKVNLISRSIKREELDHHIEHSLLSYPFIKNVERVWDLGTGGGLPGIPLATINTKQQFILNDVVNKKMMAVKNMCKKMGLQNIRFCKGEFSQISFQDSDSVVTKHAFSLDDFFKKGKTDNICRVIFYKGYPMEEDNADKIINEKHCAIYTLNHLGSFYQGKALCVFNL